MSLLYCFEKAYIKTALAKCKRNDLAVIDSDGISKAVIQSAVSMGVLVYDYINAGGALLDAKH